jgi:nucleoid-associated protein YgaU
MSDTAPTKARIKILEGKIDGKDEIECLFNPKEYTVQKSVQWNKPSGAGKNTNKLDFNAGSPATMQVELFFDTYERPDGDRDVTKYTKLIFELMKVQKKLEDPKSKKARPPKVLFMWGTSPSEAKFTFQSVVQSVSAKYTLFLANGTPVRATLNVTLLQVEDGTDLGSQNPTSGGVGGEQVWTVQEGETLALIAYKTLGATAEWRRIAAANNLANVRRLSPGTVLVIPNA